MTDTRLYTRVQATIPDELKSPMPLNPITVLGEDRPNWRADERPSVIEAIASRFALPVSTISMLERELTRCFNESLTSPTRGDVLKILKDEAGHVTYQLEPAGYSRNSP